MPTKRAPKNWEVHQVIDWPLRDPAMPVTSFGVTRRYVHRIAEEWRTAYRAALGRKHYRVKVERQPNRALRLVALIPSGTPRAVERSIFSKAAA